MSRRATATARLTTTFLATAVWSAHAWAAPPAPSAPAPAAKRADTLSPLLTLRPENGVYEGVTFSEDGRALWLLRTDSTSQTSLDAVEIAAGARPAPRFQLPLESATLESFVALPGGNGAFLRAGDKEATHSLAVVGPDGKKRWEAQNLWQVGWPSTPAGTTTPPRGLILVEKTTSGGWSVAARDPATGKPQGKPRIFEPDGKGLLKGLGLKPLSFVAGFSQLAGERPALYDKRKDTRLPSVAVTLDSLTGKVVREEPIADRFGWALTSELRAKASRADQAVFLRLADNGDATQVTLELVDALGLIHPVALPTKSRLYDRQSLVVDGPDADDRMTFTLSIDPVNADAVARKKADLPALDVFEIRTKSLGPGRSPQPGSPEVPPVEAVQRARIDLTDRPVTWLRNGDTFAILRRFKSFARGGDQVEILRFVPLP